MTEYPLTHKQILVLQWRDELNKILLAYKPTNGERLFLTCFLHDKCNWREQEIIELILKYAKWSDLNPKKTIRHVNQICEKHQSSGSGYPDETSTSETHWGNSNYKKVVETRLRRINDVGNTFVSANVFQVSPEYEGSGQETTMSRDLRSGASSAPPVTIRTFATIPTVKGDRFYRICEKEGERGGFFSIEAGYYSDIEYEGKPLKVPGRPDKYFSLPSDEETMLKVIAGLQQIIAPAAPTTITQEVEPVKKRK